LSKNINLLAMRSKDICFDFKGKTAAPDKVQSKTNNEKPDEKVEKRKPKRPLSAYNFFFHHQRQIILSEIPTRKEGKPRRSHGKIGFADLARSIASKWKKLSREERAPFDRKAMEDKKRYLREMEEWKKRQALQFSEADGVAKLEQQRGHPPFTAVGVVKESTLAWEENTSFDVVDSAIDEQSALPEEVKSDSMSTETEPFSFDEAFGTDSGKDSSGPLAGTGQRRTPNISDLANQLDDESAKLLVNLFC
jgi:hypothetical protein